MKYIIIALFFLSSSCQQQDKLLIKNDNSLEDKVLNARKVKVISPVFGNFHLELNTTAKIFAKSKVDLRFKLNEKVTKIYIHNSERVKKNQLVAKQQNKDYLNKIVKAKEQWERAKIDVEDILIGFNYSLQDSVIIPKKILKMAKNRSNYNTTLSNLNIAELEFESTILKSPINGIVANLNTKTHSFPDSKEAFCTIIDDSKFEVEFSVLEDNLAFLNSNQSFEVSTVYDDVLKGKITDINPMINKNGMIKVHGTVDNVSKNMIDGMNVNITIKKLIPGKLYIPKECIVLRDNKKVVFTYKDGYAVWKYVKTSYENHEYIVIEKGLETEDEVIYSGNINLANNSVVVKE